jgi:hypothetical protein
MDLNLCEELGMHKNDNETEPSIVIMIYLLYIIYYILDKYLHKPEGRALSNSAFAIGIIIFS